MASGIVFFVVSSVVVTCLMVVPGESALFAAIGVTAVGVWAGVLVRRRVVATHRRAAAERRARADLAYFAQREARAVRRSR